MSKVFRRIAMYWPHDGSLDSDIKSILRYELMTLELPEKGGLPKADFSQNIAIGLDMSVEDLVNNKANAFVYAHAQLLEAMKDDKVEGYGDFETGPVTHIRLNDKDDVERAHELLIDKLYPGMYKEWLGQ